MWFQWPPDVLGPPELHIVMAGNGGGIAMCLLFLFGFFKSNILFLELLSRLVRRAPGCRHLKVIWLTWPCRRLPQTVTQNKSAVEERWSCVLHWVVIKEGASTESQRNNKATFRQCVNNVARSVEMSVFQQHYSLELSARKKKTLQILCNISVEDVSVLTLNAKQLILI